MEIRENTGIESLTKRKKDLGFKYYLNTIDKNLSVPDFRGFMKCHNNQQQGGLFVPYFLLFLAKNVARLR